METMTHIEVAQDALLSMDMKYVSFSFDGGRFGATTYWPNGDIIKGTHCYGHATTLAAAIENLKADIEEVKARGKQLKTAAECKAAVLDLIREHDAAPASFRDAVYALPVKK